MNTAWQEARYDSLYLFFHSDVVMLPPGSDQPIQGVEAMVESYRQFGAMGTIHAFEIKKVDVFETDGAAMVHMLFFVDFEIEAGRFQEEGMEVYTVDVFGDNPLVVWRTQIPLKKE